MHNIIVPPKWIGEKCEHGKFEYNDKFKCVVGVTKIQPKIKCREMLV